ncbi:HemK2/MTQ2 family protein methyltransferase [Streptomyces sp. NBRC 110028]|uniref:HemK2/MTQ2 family protein methyltransferase n=1 Tax=Streptomyces sp. NBRC 110028 TaxID=1621260 RepID=UPI0006E269C3|nr:HemK2/MTQ2 family protein methyltransferase [Streptomyces sp. NBRC 110028]
MRLIAPPGVYAPQDDTTLLADAVRREPGVPGAKVLDIGTGTGALAVLAARCGAAGVEAVDVSARAVLAAWLNARLHGEPVRVRLGGLASVAQGRRFDVVLANPPYVPSRHPRPFERAGGGRAWNAGQDGREMLDRLCDRMPGLLRPRGVLLLVQSALSGVETTLERLAAQGLHADVTARRVIPFGPVLLRHSPWLVARGLIGPGEDKEELVVIRAVRTTECGSCAR